MHRFYQRAQGACGNESGLRMKHVSEIDTPAAIPEIHSASIVGQTISRNLMVLHVLPDGSGILVPRQFSGNVGEFLCDPALRYRISAAVVEELRPLMGALTEFRNGQRGGWRDMGLPSPSPGEYWLFIQ